MDFLVLNIMTYPFSFLGFSFELEYQLKSANAKEKVEYRRFEAK